MSIFRDFFAIKQKPLFTGYRFGFGAASGGGGGAVVSDFFIASGGTETTSGNYKLHTFNSDDTFQVTTVAAPGAPAANAIEILVVGGGGGGGGPAPDGPNGGGGGGGVVYIPVSANETIIDETGTYPVVIGQGGAGRGSSPNHGHSVNPGGSSYLSVPPSIGELNNRIEGVGGGGGYGSNVNAAPPGFPTGPYNSFAGPPFPMGGNPTTGGDERGPGTFPGTGTPLTTSGVGWGGNGGGSKYHGTISNNGENRGSFPSGPYNGINSAPRNWIGDGIQPVMPGLAGTYGHGFPGGFGFTIIGGYRDSGAGGGAGGYGVPGPGPGGPGSDTNGGPGYTCSISGSPVVYAGGGAGTAGSGTHGGGNATNRGGGGNSGNPGGNGFSGVVIIKYKYQ